MNARLILDGIANVVASAENFAPIATMLGGPAVGAAIKIVAAATEAAQNIAKRAEEGAVVFSSENHAELAAITAKLAKTNDSLNEYIRTH